MLSRQERQILWETEQRLAADDPGLADLMARPMPNRSPRLTKRAYDVTAVSAGLLAVLCLAVAELGAGLAAVLFCYSVLALRRAQFPPYSAHWWSIRRARS